MRARRKAVIRQLLITAMIAIGISVCIPVFVHRHDYDAALMKWMRNPTAENKAILRAETRKTNWIAFESQMEGAVILFVLLNVVWLVARLLNRPGR